MGKLDNVLFERVILLPLKKYSFFYLANLFSHPLTLRKSDSATLKKI